MGKPLEIGTPLGRAAISPQHDSVLGVRAGDAAVVHVRMAPLNSASVNLIEGAAPGPDLIALSPLGQAAALYRRETSAVQIVTGLPEAPVVAGAIDLSGQPGALSALAVRDDGALLAAFSEKQGGRVFLIRPDGAPQFVLALGHAAALVFLANNRDALAADDGENKVYLIRDVEWAGAAVVIASESEGVSRPVAVQASSDGRRAFVAGAEGAILALDLAEGTVTALACACKPAGLVRLSGDSVFQLTEGSAEPLWLLDALAEPRLVFVPADPAPEGSAEPPWLLDGVAEPRLVVVPADPSPRPEPAALNPEVQP